MVNDFVPTRDSSIALIYRLNNLWIRADNYAIEGKFERWDWVLDTIYRNLQYRNPMVKVINEKTGEVSYRIPQKDFKVYTYYAKYISKAIKSYREARKKSEKTETYSNWYQSLFEKDMWLRKMMMALGLYLKETEKRPGTAVFGSYKEGGEK